jgi:hypothetical protein
MTYRVLGVSAALLLVACARGPNVATDQLPLRRVVVYRNGVGYFERSGTVDAERVTFKMRQRMVGDFLATLAIVEHGGSSVRSASFPLEIEDKKQPEPPELDPRFQSMLKPWPGPPPKEEHDPDAMRDVILHLDGREHELAIGYVAETPVWRPSYRLVVHEDGNADLQAWGIVQNLSGEDWDGVKLALVAGAPLAFESTLGDPVIPERPIVTDTGEVIAAVPGGETSLEERAEGEVDRFGGKDEPAPAPPPPPGAVPAPEPEAAADAVGDEDLDEGPARNKADKKATKGRRVASTAAARPMAPPAPREAPAGGAAGGPRQDVPMSSTEKRRAALEEARRAGLSAPRKMSALAAVAIEAGTTRYEIPNAITVPDESATMVLLLSKRVPGEAVFLFAPDGGVPDSQGHPFRVARFTNATTGLLERGPIAVFEKGSFLGQGVVQPLPPNAKATVPFALERSLAVELERKWEQQGARLNKIEAGELWIERDQVQKTIYKAKNGSDKRAKLFVKHARLQGSRLFKPPAGTEDNTGTGSALVPIEIRPHARAELTVDERQSVQQPADWLGPLADEAVRAYLADPRKNADVAKKLGDAWQVREVLRRSLDDQNKLVDEQQELEKEARETRLSLQAIEKNAQAADLRGKLTRRLGEVTTRLDQITKRLIEIKLAINEQEVRFRDAIRGLKLLAAPPPKD